MLSLVITLSRKVPAGGVAAVNTLLGWTVIGWLVALLMACRNAPRPALPPCYRCRAVAVERHVRNDARAQAAGAVAEIRAAQG